MNETATVDSSTQLALRVEESSAIRPILSAKTSGEGSTIHLIGGEKGGVGKSLMARLLVHYMQEKQLTFCAFDADRSNAALIRYYPEVSTQILTDQHDQMDKIIEAAHQNPGQRIVVDLAAQTHDLLVKWMEEVDMVEMVREMGFRVFYWHVMDCGKDSVDLLQKLFNQFGSKLNYVVVHNQFRGEKFDLFEKSAQRQRAAELDASFITIRHLMDHVMHKIDSSNAQFAVGKHPERDSTGLGLVDRQRLKIWLTQAIAQIDKIGV